MRAGRIGAQVMLVVFALLTASGSSATTVLYADLATLGERAHLIVTGTVTHVEVVERDDATGFDLFTDYTLRVEGLEKGEHAGETLTLRLPGGALGERRVEVEGMPRFEAGQRYLLTLWRLDGARFGEPASRSYYVPLGLQQGVWALSDDDTAVRDLTGVDLYVEPGQPAPRSGRETTTLPEVLSALRSE